MLGQFLYYVEHYRAFSPRTVVAYRSDCRRFIEFREVHGLSQDATDVTTPEIRLFLVSLELGPNSVRRTLYALASFFQYLHDVEIIQRNPVSGVEPPKLKRTLPRVPSSQECQAMLDACQTPLEEVAIGLLLLGGLRRGEVLSLNMADVAADLRQVRVRGKGGNERAVPVSPALRAVLARYLESRRADHAALIVNEVGRRTGETSFYRLFARILTRAGLHGSGLSLYSLRHGFASFLIRAGADLPTVRDLLGHQNLATTSIYVHSTTETRKDAVELLPFHPRSVTRCAASPTPASRSRD